MRRRRIAPLEQGHLDGLCGIYSVINALRLATEHADESLGWLRQALQEGWDDALFSHLVRTAQKLGGRLDFIYVGLTTPRLSALIRETDCWLAKFFDLRLAVIRPFYRRSAVPLTMRCRSIATHLTAPATAAIIGTSRPWNHWTVVARVEPQRLVLVDSGGWTYAPRRRERGFEDCHAGLIRPNSVFLLTVHQVTE